MIGTYYSISSNANCTFCYQSMEDTEALAHIGNHGDQHPLHAQCIRDWIAFSKVTKCQVCQMETDGNTLVTWEDKRVVELKHLKKDFHNGALVGGIIGTAFIGTLLGCRLGELYDPYSGVVTVGGAILGLAGPMLLFHQTYHDILTETEESYLEKKIGEAGAALFGRVKTATAGEIALGITGGVFLVIGVSAIPFLRDFVNIGAKICVLGASFGVMGGIAGSVINVSKNFFFRRIGWV